MGNLEKMINRLKDDPKGKSFVRSSSQFLNVFRNRRLTSSRPRRFQETNHSGIHPSLSCLGDSFGGWMTMDQRFVGIVFKKQESQTRLIPLDSLILCQPRDTFPHI